MESAVILIARRNGTIAQGLVNSIGGAQGGGAGWLYGWTLTDERVQNNA
jgi:hypothetical protein